MKVGMIFECGPHGADRKVCELLARKLDPELELVSITLDNKKKLVADCGKAAANLLEMGCERVVILWDLHPAWRETKPCRKIDRQEIHRVLLMAEVDMSKVFLICIQEELEAWLVADKRALEAVLSRTTRPVTLNEFAHPERVRNPKKQLMRLFQQEAHRPYNDLVDAEKIVKAMPDLSRLKRCQTFRRFAKKLIDIEI